MAEGAELVLDPIPAEGDGRACGAHEHGTRGNIPAVRELISTPTGRSSTMDTHRDPDVEPVNHPEMPQRNHREMPQRPADTIGDGTPNLGRGAADGPGQARRREQREPGGTGAQAVKLIAISNKGRAERARDAVKTRMTVFDKLPESDVYPPTGYSQKTGASS